MAHPVVHFELSGPDDRQLAGFYSQLFGWQVRPVPGIGYTLLDTGGGINGGIATSTDSPATATFYIETDDLQMALDKINLIGGKTLRPITELPGMVTYALFEDLDGLVVGLMLGAGESGVPTTAQAEVPAAGQAEAPAVDWFEVLGADAARSQRFYTEIFGWQVSAAASGVGYGMVDTGTSRGIRGGIGGGGPGPWATVYASVTDVAATLASATELGGSRVSGPAAVDDHMEAGALRDPAGNAVGVYRHS
jgi:predicted enzyme related to lactoylglutathione lyase